jgi:hypothetical protein
MSDGVALAGGPVTIKAYGALAVEVGGCHIAVEVTEDRRQGLPALWDVGRFGAFAVHVDGEAGVYREESSLSFRVAPVCAVSVGVEQFPDRQAVGSFLGRERGVGCRGKSLPVYLTAV